VNYLSKLLKKNDYKEGCKILQEIIIKVESMKEEKINNYNKDKCLLLSIMVILFFFYFLRAFEAFESCFEKAEELLKSMKEKGILQKRPFAFDYYMVLLWEYK
jgi:hypothetical protein